MINTLSVRVHCALVHHSNGSVWLFDLKSNHGTKVNGAFCHSMLMYISATSVILLLLLTNQSMSGKRCKQGDNGEPMALQLQHGGMLQVLLVLSDV